MSVSNYDAVVIGSGLGGLTAAALLAKSGRSVCVLERNHTLGGAASRFRHGDLVIEPSLHQTADPRDPDEPKHAILCELGLLDEIIWTPITPAFSVYGGIVGEMFDTPVGFEAAREAYAKRFPASRAGSDALFKAIETLHRGVAHLAQARAERSLTKLWRGGLELRELARDWRASVDEVLQRRLGSDEAAKLAFGSNIAYYADSARRLAWPFFAVAQGGFLKSGGVFVKGGSYALSLKLAKVVLEAGGVVRLGREATRIDLDGSGRPTSVTHVDARGKANEERVGARMALANCAPQVAARLLSGPASAAFERAYGTLPLSTSLFTAHFGLSEPPARFGLTRYTAARAPDWLGALADLDQSARLLADDPGARLPLFGVANYGAIDSGLNPGGLTLVSAVGLDRVDNWAGLTPDQEKARRERWLDALQAALDRDYPGFGSAVKTRMFLNACSMRGFLNTPEGAVYGFAPAPFRRGLWAGVPRSPRTPTPGLYLASSFAGSGGFTGAMRAGADAAAMAQAEQL